MTVKGIGWALGYPQKRGMAAPAPPSNVVAPDVSPNVVLVGETFTCTTGTWAGNPAPTFTFQWQKGGTDIPGATSNTYMTTEDDVGYEIICIVTATNSQGTVQASSDSVQVVTSYAPVNIVLPEISGDPTAGNILTCSTGTWTTGPFPAPTFAYQWYLDGEVIVGAQYETYQCKTSEAGKTLTCVVTATNSQGSSGAQSNGVIVKSPPLATVDPTVTGTPAVGQTLTRTTGNWIGYPAPVLSTQWRRDGVDIAGQTGATYVVIAEDETKTISCRVTGVNSVGSYSAFSNGVVIGAALTAPVNTTLPSISGIPQQDQTLNSTSGVWTGNPTPTYSYQWFKNGVFLSNGNAGNSSLLTLSPSLGLVAGDIITSRVTATNSQGSATAISNELVYTVTPAPPINITPPSVTPTTAYGTGEILHCDAGEWQGVPTPVITYQWLRNNVVISGATAILYNTVAADIGTAVSCVVTATNSEGTLAIESNDCNVVPAVDRLLKEDGFYLLLESGDFLLLE